MTGSEPHEPGAGPPEGEPSDPGALPPGFAVGEYRIERPLGRGGMGSVYAAQQPEIGARVAVKVLAAELSRDPRLVQRFVDEARAVNKIRHPNIIDIFAFGRLPDRRQYFVMELLDGETLAARLERGPLPPSEARRLLLQICEGLEAAHQSGIVHRDLKPENLWIATPRHGQPYAKILDFGIAKLAEDRDASLATETGLAMGTPHFMAPEQCRGETTIDARADIYAMGVILYKMFTGRLPFEGASFLAVVTQQITAAPPPPSAHARLPPRLEALILRCLQKDPAARPQSARALGQELGEILADALPGETLAPAAGAVLPADTTTSSSAKPAPGPGDEAPSRGRAGRRAVGVAIAIAIVGVIAAGAAVIGARGERAPAATAPAAAVAPAPAPSSAVPVAPPPAAAVAPVPAAAAAPRAKPAPRARARRDEAAPTPAVGRPPSRLEENGYLKENPFR